MQSFLKKFGLSDKEIQLYVATLELGEASIAQAAEAAGIHRVAAYDIVDQLVKKGLLIVTDTQSGRRLTATSPKYIQALIDGERRDLRKLELKYQRALPSLMSLYSEHSLPPKVQFFEGRKGLQQMNADIIETMTTYPKDKRILYSYVDPVPLDTYFQEEIFGVDGFVTRRSRLGIFLYAIAPDSKTARQALTKEEEKLSEILILPRELFPMKNDLRIYGNKVAIQSIDKEMIGVIIESEDIAADQLAIFKITWEGAKAVAKTKKLSL